MRIPWLTGWGARAALAIGDEAVDLLSTRDGRVQAHVRVPLEGRQGPPLTQAIRQALAAASLKTAAPAVSISDQVVLLRSFTMPALPKAEWDTAVQFEARKYIPFKPQELLWNYHVIQPSAAGKLEVLFAAVQPDAFRGIQEALAAAGVSPTLIEPRSVSLARLTGPSKGQPSTEFACLVDVAGDTAHLAIVKDQMPYLTRSASLSLKTEAAAPRESEPAAEGMTDRRAHRLLSELSVSLDFFTREYPAAHVGQVWLFGDESLLAGWCWWLAERLQRPVDVGRPLVTPQISGDLPLSFASTVGLLRADPHRAALNFLRQQPKPGAPTALTELSVAGFVAALKRPQTVMMAGVMAGALGLLWMVGSRQVDAARGELAQLVQSRPALGVGLAGKSKDDLAPLEAQATAAIAWLRPVMDQRIGVTSKLDALAHALPDGVWITGLRFESAIRQRGRSAMSLMLHGACYLGQAGDELVAIQAFGDHIKREPRFFQGFTTAQVDAINAERAESSTYRTFQLRCDSG